MTGTDFLDKLNDQQRAWYVNGVLDGMTYDMPVPKAACVRNWYYEGEGPRQLIGAVRQYRDKPVQGILQVLVKRLCQA
jgi:hypothetical protein